MSTPPDNLNGDVEGIEENGPSRDGEIEVFLKSLISTLSGFTEQEKHRIAVQREVALRTLEATQEVERLQHDLSLKRIEAEDEQHKRRYGLGRIVVAIVGVVFLVLLGLTGLAVAMAFFGNETQSQTALSMLGYGFAAVGGGGIFFFIGFLINSMARWWQGM